MQDYIEHAVRGEIRLRHSKGKFSALVTAIASADRYDDNFVLLALSIVGAGTALDAVRATASKGQPLPFFKAGGGENLLTTEGQKYRLFKARLQQRDHYILLNNTLFEPALEGWHYFAAPIGQEPAQVLGQALRRVSLIPVLPSWYDAIYRASQSQATLFTRVAAEDGFAIWRIKVDDADWHKLIAGLLQQRLITMEGAS